jgi:hypothetical protein
VAEILSHPGLEAKSEDSLYDFIVRRAAADPGCFALFESIRFECLSAREGTAFFELIETKFDNMALRIWRNVRSRFVVSQSEMPPNDRYETEGTQKATKTFPPARTLEGIICHLTEIAQLSRKKRGYFENMALFRDNILIRNCAIAPKM